MVLRTGIVVATDEKGLVNSMGLVAEVGFGCDFQH